MVILLLGLDQIFTGKFDADGDEAKQLRDDVEQNRNVISDNSIFTSLVNKTRNGNAAYRSSLKHCKNSGSDKI